MLGKECENVDPNVRKRSPLGPLSPSYSKNESKRRSTKVSNIGFSTANNIESKRRSHFLTSTNENINPNLRNKTPTGPINSSSSKKDTAEIPCAKEAAVPATAEQKFSNSQNGMFSPYRESTLTPNSVQAIKSAHPNVKALASLSGWSIGSKVLRWYTLDDSQLWITNAFSSLKSLITTYHLDGIDIDYENFKKHNGSFAYCIGYV